MRAMSALADPTRRRIVELLARRDRTAGEIVAEFDLTPPAISQHLKILRRAGLVRVRVEGQHRVQMLNPAGLVEIETWLARTMRARDKCLLKETKAGRILSDAPAVVLRRKPNTPVEIST